MIKVSFVDGGAPSNDPAASSSSNLTPLVRFMDVRPLALLGVHILYGTGLQSTISSLKSAFLLTPILSHPSLSYSTLLDPERLLLICHITTRQWSWMLRHWQCTNCCRRHVLLHWWPSHGIHIIYLNFPLWLSFFVEQIISDYMFRFLAHPPSVVPE